MNSLSSWTVWGEHKHVIAERPKVLWSSSSPMACLIEGFTPVRRTFWSEPVNINMLKPLSLRVKVSDGPDHLVVSEPLDIIAIDCLETDVNDTRSIVWQLTHAISKTLQNVPRLSVNGSRTMAFPVEHDGLVALCDVQGVFRHLREQNMDDLRIPLVFTR